jgi:hypothetical protein
VMISTRSMGFDIGVRLGLRLGPPGYADCPVELGAAPLLDTPARRALDKLTFRLL